jgi:hypothetical protein
MTNDKDSAVLADKSDEYAIGHLSALLEVELHENGHTIGEDLAEKLAEIAVKTVRQPTQSDALLEGDTQTILYLLGVRHGREDERAKIAAERQAGYAAGVEAAAKALEADAMKCDCAALEERECGCGAWCEWKSITSARAVEIVRELKNVPPPEGDGGHRRSDGGEVGK